MHDDEGRGARATAGFSSNDDLATIVQGRQLIMQNSFSVSLQYFGEIMFPTVSHCIATSAKITMQLRHQAPPQSGSLASKGGNRRRISVARFPGTRLLLS